MAGLMQQVKDVGSRLNLSSASHRGYQPVVAEGARRQTEVSSPASLVPSAG